MNLIVHEGLIHTAGVSTADRRRKQQTALPLSALIIKDLSIRHDGSSENMNSL